MATPGDVDLYLDNSSTPENLIDQLEREETFRELKSYRVYQKELLSRAGMEKEPKDVDKMIDDGSYWNSTEVEIEPPKSLYIDQIFRASEKIAEELLTYQEIFNELDRYFSENRSELKAKYAEETIKTKPGERTETPLDRYTDLKKEFKLLKSAFAKLVRENDSAYTEPLEQAFPPVESSAL